MKVLQLGFSKSPENPEIFDCNVLIENTNFSTWYFGTPALPGMLNPGIVETLVGYLSNDGVQVAPKKVAVNQPVKCSYVQLVGIVSAIFHQLNVGNYTITVDTNNPYRVIVTFFSGNLDHGMPIQIQRTLGFQFNLDLMLGKLVGLAVPLEQNNDPWGVKYDMKVKEPAGKSKKAPKLCKSCGNNYGVEEVKTSVGKIPMCSACRISQPCGLCEFVEPNCYLNRGIRISDDTGKNEKFLVCRKCSGKMGACNHCGHFYNTKEYKPCPCQIAANFKPHIKAHNDDVLSYYQMDMFSDELFGIEIEVGTLNKNRRMFPEIAQATNQLIINNAILKYDSSIDFINKQDGVDNDFKGFEVVTRPMVYKNAMRFLKEFCKNKHPMLKSWEVGTCGLHIHVSKTCLRPIEIGKILLFINDKSNRKFIKMIAKREDKRFAKFLTKTIMDYRNNSPDCHYEAINTNKPHTIEFRIFRGTLNVQTVMSYLQFVKSVIDFVRVTNKDRLSYQDYTKYLFGTERSQFRELKERITTENLRDIKDRGEI